MRSHRSRALVLRAWLRMMGLGSVLATSGVACQATRTHDEAAIETMDELSALTDALIEIVETADDARAGVAAAQQRLDAERATLGPRVAELLARPSAALGTQARGHVARVMVELPAKLAELQIELRAKHPNDEALAAALERLVADHRDLTRGH